MSTTAQTIIDRAATLLHDSANTRWPVSEMLNWLGDAQRDAVLIKPDAYTKTIVLTLAAGTRQTLASTADMNLLLRLSRNMASDGVTPGRVIRVVAEEMLDGYNPDWHSATPVATILHYTYDPATPGMFQVYPPAAAGTKVEAIYSALPAIPTSVGDTIALQDSLSVALTNYLCYRALSKDAEFGDNAVKAASYYKLFTDALGYSTKQQAEASPNLVQGPFNPTNLASAK